MEKLLRHDSTMVIGDNNIFQVGCRESSHGVGTLIYLGADAEPRNSGIEAASVGASNTFGSKSRVSHSVAISSHCNIGAGCTVLANPFGEATGSAEHVVDDDVIMDDSPLPPVALDDATQSDVSIAISTSTAQTLPDYTVVFGSENKRRIWSGEGAGQAKAMHVKHLEYLRAMLVSSFSLLMVYFSTDG